MAWDVNCCITISYIFFNLAYFAPACRIPHMNIINNSIRANPPDWLTFNELCIYLPYSPRKLREMISQRKIPYVNDSGLPGHKGKQLFNRESVNVALKKLSVEALY